MIREPCGSWGTCDEGVCQSSFGSCDDGNPCTEDSCSEDGECVFSPLSGNSCLNGGCPGECQVGVCTPQNVECPLSCATRETLSCGMILRNQHLPEGGNLEESWCSENRFPLRTNFRTGDSGGSSPVLSSSRRQSLRSSSGFTSRMTPVSGEIAASETGSGNAASHGIRTVGED